MGAVAVEGSAEAQRVVWRERSSRGCLKAADSSINRRDELWYASDSDALDRRDWHVRRFAPADSLRMGDGPVTEWVARLEKLEQA